MLGISKFSEALAQNLKLLHNRRCLWWIEAKIFHSLVIICFIIITIVNIKVSKVI